MRAQSGQPMDSRADRSLPPAQLAAALTLERLESASLKSLIFLICLYFLPSSGGHLPAKRVIVLDLVCLQAEHLQDESRTPNLSRLAREGWSAPLVPPFPAVTCTVQATLTTGAP